jgi:phage gpG-like protein
MVGKVKILVDDAKLQKRLNAMLGALEHKQSLFEALGRKLRTLILLGFKQSKDPWGRAWLPLRFRSGQPLLDTGRLRSSITYVATSQFVEVGTNVRYARTHQFGAVIKPKSKPALVFPNKLAGGLVFAKKVTIPKRPFMPLDAQGQLDLPGSWQKGLLGVITGHLRKVAEVVPA